MFAPVAVRHERLLGPAPGLDPDPARATATATATATALRDAPADDAILQSGRTLLGDQPPV
ncbi:hypothetical protein KDL01_09215 [Actinospica durhamensis]|uniref:Uncharacterized protein n=1 Tax=Actinospica durhamensis TaxID=1508375 RepID=A0A941IN06_9ACTN|nr:hypothetical protein [Actinospica durhamensis]MBR7833444.1 hypothetical protein [Actinospica durhamensis]